MCIDDITPPDDGDCALYVGAELKLGSPHRQVSTVLAHTNMKRNGRAWLHPRHPTGVEIAGKTARGAPTDLHGSRCSKCAV
jgi:hypothetical protein